MKPAVRTATAVLGVVLLLAAALLTFVIVPGQAQLPADTDSTRTYTGQISSLLNAEALASGDLANAVLRDLPITITQNVAVTEVADGIATVTDASTITLPDGTPLLQTGDQYSVDRKTMESQGETQGLVIGWPIGADAVDTAGWSGALQTTVPYVYEATEERAGIETRRYTSNESGRIVDAGWLATVPASIPSAMLVPLAGALEVPAAIAGQLAASADQLPTEVPLAYLINNTTTYWVDATTGMVIDAEVTETRSVALDIPGFESTPLAPVLDLAYTGEEASVANAADEAQSLGGQLQTFGTTLPLVLSLAGVALLIVSTLRRKKDDELVIDVSAAEKARNAGASDTKPKTPVAK